MNHEIIHDSLILFSIVAMIVIDAQIYFTSFKTVK